MAEVDGTCLVVEVKKAAYEGVSEAIDMVGISYFLGENVAHIVVSNDVLYVECGVLETHLRTAFSLNSVW